VNSVELDIAWNSESPNPLVEKLLGLIEDANDDA
jgi:hypothetical protein